ncbi:hypothetical protein ABIA16_005910 [Sinorhizobium fredii]
MAVVRAEADLVLAGTQQAGGNVVAALVRPVGCLHRSFADKLAVHQDGQDGCLGRNDDRVLIGKGQPAAGLRLRRREIEGPGALVRFAGERQGRKRQDEAPERRCRRAGRDRLGAAGAWRRISSLRRLFHRRCGTLFGRALPGHVEGGGLCSRRRAGQESHQESEHAFHLPAPASVLMLRKK